MWSSPALADAPSVNRCGSLCKEKYEPTLAAISVATIALYSRADLPPPPPMPSGLAPESSASATMSG